MCSPVEPDHIKMPLTLMSVSCYSNNYCASTERHTSTFKDRKHFFLPRTGFSLTLSDGKPLLDLAYSELLGSIMNLAEGETKGITSTKLLFFPVGALEL